MRAWLLLFFAAFLALSCAKPEPPRVTPKAIRVAALGPAMVDLVLDLDVYNPNSFDLRVHAVEGGLALDTGVEIARGRALLERPLPAKQTALVSSTLSIPWVNLGALLPFATSSQPVPYKFKGIAKVGGEKLNVDIPFELSGALSGTDLLQIAMRGLPNLLTPPPVPAPPPP